MSEIKQKMRSDMIGRLNEILQYERYHFEFYFHASLEMTGLARMILKQFMEKEMASELEHMKLFGDKIVSLGGKPTYERLEKKMVVFGSMAFHEVIRAACEMEQDVLKLYHEVYGEAEKYAEVFDDKSIVLLLEENIEHTTADMEEMSKMY